jgi:hypothetical protein
MKPVFGVAFQVSVFSSGSKTWKLDSAAGLLE